MVLRSNHQPDGDERWLPRCCRARRRPKRGGGVLVGDQHHDRKLYRHHRSHSAVRGHHLRHDSAPSPRGRSALLDHGLYPAAVGLDLYGSLYDNSGTIQYNPFQVAPELTQYKAWQLQPDGSFAPFSSDPSQNQQLLWLGPTFTYDIGSSRPVLTIAPTNSNSIILTWPTNAVGFVLQSSAVVKGSYTNVPGSPSVAGTSYTAILPRTNAAAFFRLAKQN